MPIYDFKCQCGHKEEKLISLANREDNFPCPDCGKEMRRVISPCRFKLDGCSGDFPTAYDAWERTHNEALSKAKRRARENGTLEIE